MEIWKEVEDANGEYLVSSYGAVKSRKKKKEAILVLNSDKKGYLNIKINRRSMKVHRLVALAFIPNPENKPQVNHKDGNKSNNTVSNLEWATGLENMRHSWANGLHCSRKGELHGRSKISDATRKEIAGKHAAGATLLSLAKEYSFTPTHILRICKAHGTHRKRVAKYTGEAKRIRKLEILRAFYQRRKYLKTITK